VDLPRSAGLGRWSKPERVGDGSRELERERTLLAEVLELRAVSELLAVAVVDPPPFHCSARVTVGPSFR
jgi:hypothetical protein